MDGSSLSVVLIPVVVVISLATWLILVAYAASHPNWKHRPASSQAARTTPPPQARIPAPRTAIRRPARRRAGTKPVAAGGH